VAFAAPAGSPFESSTELTGIVFTGRYAQYGHADTWYPSWAADGNLYSPWTDGEVNGITHLPAARLPGPVMLRFAAMTLCILKLLMPRLILPARYPMKADIHRLT